MILADKITDLRKKNGWSQEELAEKLDVSRQAVSKWESAQSVPDMARILKLSEVFGVSTDYLLKDELGTPDVAELPDTGSPAHPVSMEEAHVYLDLKRESSLKVAAGVMLCVMSPILLLFLGGAQEYGKIALSESQAGGLGLIVLILLIGAGVYLFITTGLRMSRYEFMEHEPLDTLYGVSGMVRERQEQYRPVFARELTGGIILCVISVLPLGISLLFARENEFYHVIAISAMLLMIAAGVFFIVRTAIIWDSFHILLEEEDYTREMKEEKKSVIFPRIYWPLVTAGYLAWSFITNDWAHTWIIWPVAGVAFAGIYAIIKALKQKQQ